MKQQNENTEIAFHNIKSELKILAQGLKDKEANLDIEDVDSDSLLVKFLTLKVNVKIQLIKEHRLAYRLTLNFERLPEKYQEQYLAEGQNQWRRSDIPIVPNMPQHEVDLINRRWTNSQLARRAIDFAQEWIKPIKER